VLQIDRLSIHLPKSLQHRANDIAHEMAGCLSRLPLRKSLRIERLAVPAVSIHPQASNQEIARSVATAIHAGIGGNK
jgi:hypothetical protein